MKNEKKTIKTISQFGNGAINLMPVYLIYHDL